MTPSVDAVGRRLALRLFALSIVCWWVLGLAFSGLWWLTNRHQLAWILFCYAWEVPAIGWTGVVMIPWFRWNRIARLLRAQDPRSVHALGRLPWFIALCAIATSTIGYVIGAIQLILFAHLPLLEATKICVQGPMLGALLAAALFLEAERATRSVPLSDGLLALAAAEPRRYTLASKMLFLTATIALGAGTPIFLFGLTREQRGLETVRALELEHALAMPGTWTHGVVRPLPALGTHTAIYATTSLPVRVSSGTIVPLADTPHATVFQVDDLWLDAADTLFAADSGWFASRFDGHRVVAFRYVDTPERVLLLGVSPLADYGHALASSTLTAAGVGVVALAVALLLALALARSVVDPLRRLHDAAGAMAGGRRDVAMVAAVGSDEVAALTYQFDTMAARIRADEENLRAAQDQLVRSEKLSAVGHVVSGIAHELNNPLAAILHFADNLLAERNYSPADGDTLHLIAAQARRARSIVRDLLSFVRARSHQQDAADIHAVARQTVESVGPLVAETGAQVVLSPAPDVPLVQIDALGIEQVLTNLIVNGAQAAGIGGVVSVTIEPAGDRVRILVADTGPGIPGHVLPRVFEPFFTTKGPGKGTGLGLSVSLGIIQQHGGQLMAENRQAVDGGGARFTLDVPTHPDQAAAAATLAVRRERAEATLIGAAIPANGAVQQAAARHTVMLIDDEEPIRLALRMYLERTGWAVEEAESGRAALDRLLTAPDDHYCAVITDLTMPDINGIQIHDALATARPDLCSRLIIATGEAISDTVVAFRARSGRPFLEKPFELGALTALLEQMA